MKGKARKLYSKLRHSAVFLYLFLAMGVVVALFGFFNSVSSVEANDAGRMNSGLYIPTLRIRQAVVDGCDLCNENIEVMPGGVYPSVPDSSEKRVHYTLINYLLDSPEGGDRVYYDTYDIAVLGVLVIGVAVAGIATRKPKRDK